MTQSASGNEKRGNKKILWASMVVVVVIIVVVAAATAVILSKPPTKKSNTVYFYTWWGPTSGRALQIASIFHLPPHPDIAILICFPANLILFSAEI